MNPILIILVSTNYDELKSVTAGRGFSRKEFDGTWLSLLRKVTIIGQSSILSRIPKSLSTLRAATIKATKVHALFEYKGATKLVVFDRRCCDDGELAQRMAKNGRNLKHWY